MYRVAFTLYTLFRGRSVNTQDNYRDTALMEASRRGHTGAVKLLIDNGADVNCMNSYGEIALIEASDNGHIEVVKLLIEAGADVNARDHGTTALMEASIDGYLEIVKMLIEAEADLNIQYSGVIYLDSDKEITGKVIERKFVIKYYQYTVLMLASEMGHADIVKLLLNAGADVNVQNDAGRTALIIATDRNNNDIVQLLNEACDKK